VFRRIKVYNRLPEPLYEWASFGSLLMDSELPLTAYEDGERGGFFANNDVAYVDLPFETSLVGDEEERLELSFAGDIGELVTISCLASGSVEQLAER
jgi:hypothetical protein